MSQATVLALVDLLSNNIADDTVTPGLYSDVVFDWGSQPILTNGTLISLSAKAEEFQLPPQVLNVLSIVWDQRELGKLTLREVEALNSSWRNKIGTPNSFIEQAETAKTLALYPTPFMPSGPNLVITGEPFGLDYPLYSVVLLNTETRQDVPIYLELPLALLILEREFVRESDHKDMDFAQIAGDFGRWLLSLHRGTSPDIRMKTQKVSAHPKATPDVADLVNQLNRILPEFQKAAEATQLAVQQHAAQLATIKTTLQGLTPQALTALINSVTGG